MSTEKTKPFLCPLKAVPSMIPNRKQKHLLRIFFLDFFYGDWSLRTGPPPPLKWNSFLPLVTAELITLKGAESPGSHCIGVIGALVLILPSKTVKLS